MDRLSRQDISQKYCEGEEIVVASVEFLYDTIVSLEARIAVLEGLRQKNSKSGKSSS